MKTVILFTVIESLALMLATMYLYYRRSQPRKRALVLRPKDVFITEPAKLVLSPGYYSQRSSPNQSAHTHDMVVPKSNQ
jgi:hypothetical protein